MTHIRIYKIMFMTVIFFTLILPVSVFAETNWEFTETQGFSFEYPEGWQLTDMGDATYGDATTIGYTQVLGSPDKEAATMVLMFFPSFTLDLKTAGMEYIDFVKMVFEQFLDNAKITGQAVEETETEFNHGTVNGYMVSSDEDPGFFRAAAAYGDMKAGTAVLVIMTMKLAIAEEDKSDLYIDHVEKILKSITFPGGFNKK
ncbi:MAG: hypothetical protein JW904_13075 [Spirochaetales bacterium]|nr:hypothetical protein [Spirochaetales bacterium]